MTAAGDNIETHRGKGRDVSSRATATGNLVETPITTHRFNVKCVEPSEE